MNAQEQFPKHQWKCRCFSNRGHENGLGMGEIDLKISGNEATEVGAVIVKIEGAAIPGGTYTALIDNSRYFDPEQFVVHTLPALPSTGKSTWPCYCECRVENRELKELERWNGLPARDRIVARRRRGQ
ncbi:MAG: hypothetical protein IPP17_27185 [Bacteroidetes bacterium]|nr:hypothetical protein [Bacteroidota bacterium]